MEDPNTKGMEEKKRAIIELEEKIMEMEEREERNRINFKMRLDSMRREMEGMREELEKLQEMRVSKEDKNQERSYEEMKERIKMEVRVEKLEKEVERLNKERSTDVDAIKVESERKEQKVDLGEEEKKREREKREAELRAVEDRKRKHALVVRKGRYGRECDIKEWLEEIGVKGRYLVIKANEKCTVLYVDFENEEDREKVWKVERKEKFTDRWLIEEWLSVRERVLRYKLWEKTERIRMRNEEEGISIKIVKENNKIIIEGRSYALDSRGSLVEVKEESKKKKETNKKEDAQTQEKKE